MVVYLHSMIASYPGSIPGLRAFAHIGNFTLNFQAIIKYFLYIFQVFSSIIPKVAAYSWVSATNIS